MPIRTAAEDIHKYFFHCFSEKIRLDVSSESSARQRIHMKNQALFSSKDKSKKLKCLLLQFLFGALRVKCVGVPVCQMLTYCRTSVARTLMARLPRLFRTRSAVPWKNPTAADLG